MAVGYLTTDSLIALIKRKAMIPSTQNTFTTDDFLSFINEEIDVGIVPYLISTKEEYLVYSADTTLVANQSRYAIPYRAIGTKIRDVFYKDSNGNLFEMVRVNPEDKPHFQQTGVINSYTYFYIEGNDIVLLPDVGSTVSGSLNISYYLRPNDLVDEDRVCVISSINTSTGVITVDEVPTNITVGSTIDFLQSKPGHRIRDFDISVTSVDTTLNTITVAAADLPSDLVVGDHIASAGECIIPNIPSELHPVLAERVAARCLEALGDINGLQAANAKIQEMENKALQLVDNRVEGAPQKVVNRKGLLRSAKIRKRDGINLCLNSYLINAVVYTLSLTI